MTHTKPPIALFVALALVHADARTWAADVIVDAGTVYQRIDGFGSSQRVFDDPHVFENFNPATARAATVLTTAQQDAVLDRLYGDLQLTRLRPASPDPGSGVEPQNDNADPNILDASKFNFTWKNLDAHADYLTRVRPRGVTTWFLSPISRETWMGTSTAADAAEYAEWLLAQALRCQTRGVSLPFLSVANEPSYSRNTMSGEFIRDVIKILGPKLRAANLPTLFVIPDDVRSSDAAAKTRTILVDPAARSYVGALATHLYDEPISNVSQMRALSDQYGLPLWMTEFSLTLARSAGLGNGPFDYAGLIHDLLANYNVSAVDYQWGFFGEWEAGSQLVVLNYDRGRIEAYTGYTLTKEYYLTGQYSKFVRPGARRIRADSLSSSIRVTAYLNGPELTIIAFNSAMNGSQTLSLRLTGLPEISTINSVRTSATENWNSLPAISVNGSTFSATLPQQSVTTFTATLPTASARLTNVSVRSTAGAGAQTLIVGFNLTGTVNKQILLRGIGPTLASFSVSGAVADPQLRLFNSAGAQINENDDWGGGGALAAAFSAVGAFALPNNSRDAALLLSLPAGSYSAQLTTATGTGIALVEGYDIDDSTTESRLNNVSVRGDVGTDANVLIVGFAIAGTTAKTILIRAVGPTLATFGVSGVLADPQLQLFNSKGIEINRNDNWGGASALESAFASVAAFALPSNSSDAALLVTLVPGNYTAQVRGADGTSGVALVELYGVP